MTAFNPDEPTLIVFDCDGTLVDSAHMVVSSMQEAFEDVGEAAPHSDAIRHIIGLSLDRAVLALAPGRGDAFYSHLTEAFRARYHPKRMQGADVEPLYEGCAAVLHELAQRPQTLLGVATGKGRRGLNHTLDVNGIAHLFQVLKTADDGPSKPDPKILVDACSEMGVSPWNTVMIGDTIFDMETAKQAGSHAIGVSWGYHQSEALTKAGAIAVATHYDQIPSFIDELRGKEA